MPGCYDGGGRVYSPGATDARIANWHGQIAQRNAAGNTDRKEVWWYQIGPDSPLTWTLDDSLTTHALAPTAAFVKNVRGWILWTTHNWVDGDPWAGTAWARNSGTFIYPSRTSDPSYLHPSLRLLALHEGEVLYEYLMLVSAKDSAFAMQQAKRLARGFFDVTADAALFADVKAQLAGRLP
jgi:hypothetical protein